MSVSEIIEKIFEDAYFKIVNFLDATKRLVFDLNGATSGKTMTLRASHAEDITVNLPRKSGTLEVVEADRIAQTSFSLDYSQAEIQVMNMTASGTLSVTNPVQGKAVLLEVTPNNFTLSFPPSVRILSGKFKPTTVNYVYFHCVDGATPTYVVTIGQQVA